MPSPRDQPTVPTVAAGLSESPDFSVWCVITRMRMRRPWHVVIAYRRYRRVRSAAARRRPPGLLKSAFLVEGPLTCFSLSLWDREPQLSAFVPEHIAVVNTTFGSLRECPDGGPELWSTTWQLLGASRNLRWSGLEQPGQVAGEGIAQFELRGVASGP